MAFNNNNNFGNSNNGQSGEKKRTNFPVGDKIWGQESVLTVSVWVANTGVKAIIRAKQIVGKDPSTGASVLEQKMSGDLPSFFIDTVYLNALITAMESCQDPGSINIVMDKGNGSKFSMIGQGSTIKITIEHPKTGTRTCTLDAISVNNKNIHARFNVLLKYLQIAYKKALFNKLDPEEFAMIGAPTEESGNDEDVPF